MRSGFRLVRDIVATYIKKHAAEIKARRQNPEVKAKNLAASTRWRIANRLKWNATQLRTYHKRAEKNKINKIKAELYDKLMKEQNES